jgi:hypothetical protein
MAAMVDTEDVRALYRQPPESFIAARDALAKTLREEGRTADAKEVKALRKPTVPAWAVNQLAAADPQGVEELLAAGADLRGAQQAALSGRQPDRLRAAMDARRAAVGRLAKVAASVLEGAGRSVEPHADDIAATLEAASIDPEAGERVRAGVLERPLPAATGFADIVGLRAVPTPKDTSSPARRTSASDAEEQRAVDDGDRAADAVDMRLSALEAEVARLSRERDAAERRARRAGDDEARANERIAAAEERLETVRLRARDAREAAQHERDDVRRLTRALERAEARFREAKNGAQ